jgi:hypothetical protein
MENDITQHGYPASWRDSITQAELNQLEGERDFWKREAKRYRDLYEVAQEEVEKLRKYSVRYTEDEVRRMGYE